MFWIFAQFWIGFMIGLSGTLLPGPLLAFVVSDSVKRGWKSGPKAALGHGIVEVALIFLLAFGVIVLWPESRGIIGIVGGFALLIFGVLMARSALGGKLKVEEERQPKYGSVIGGIAFTVFNPTWIPWWVGVGLPALMVALNTAAIPGAIAWGAGHLFSDFGWYAIVSTSVWRGKFYLGTRLHKAMILVCAVFLIAFGSLILLFPSVLGLA